MRIVRKPSTRVEMRRRRHLRVRKKVNGSAERPRLVIFRSLKHIYAQLVDDDQHKTLMGVTETTEGVKREKPGKVGAAHAVGKHIAHLAKERGIKKVVFDRAGYMYHGRVKAVADGAREGGLEL
ncbi:MAG: 50S ribosomal protein L18 [Gemmatimonadetes bacterium]|nr:50S ribosomal protein L18 [Gemmatimonadota bacterium]